MNIDKIIDLINNTELTLKNNDIFNELFEVLSDDLKYGQNKINNYMKKIKREFNLKENVYYEKKNNIESMVDLCISYINAEDEYYSYKFKTKSVIINLQMNNDDFNDIFKKHLIILLYPECDRYIIFIESKVYILKWNWFYHDTKKYESKYINFTITTGNTAKTNGIYYHFISRFKSALQYMSNLKEINIENSDIIKMKEQTYNNYICHDNFKDMLYIIVYYKKKNQVRTNKLRCVTLLRHHHICGSLKSAIGSDKGNTYMIFSKLFKDVSNIYKYFDFDICKSIKDYDYNHEMEMIINYMLTFDDLFKIDQIMMIDCCFKELEYPCDIFDNLLRIMNEIY